MPATTYKVTVMDYRSGDSLGQIDRPEQYWRDYQACHGAAYQWPQGIAEASDVLSGDEIRLLEISPGTTIYLA